MNPNSERGRQNQREYRHANRRFLDVLRRSPATQDGQLMPFICECADGDCAGRIEITPWRYEDIHADERDYVILPAHAHRGRGDHGSELVLRDRQEGRVMGRLHWLVLM
jgi:hypothetical protein